MKRLPILIVVLAALLAAPAAHAAPAVNGIFNLPAQPSRAALGPDGNMWVTLNNNDPDYVKIAPDGTVTPYSAPNIAFPTGIAAGADGRLWITGGQYVGRFFPADPETVTKTDIALLNQPQDLVAHPDGNLWTASGANAFRLQTALAIPQTPFLTNVTNFDARGITVSTDGRIWISNAGDDAGVVPMSSVSGNPGTYIPLGVAGDKALDVEGGPNGQLAYTIPVIAAGKQRVGLINADGTLGPKVEFDAPGPDATGIALGQDGAYWIGQFTRAAIGRLTTDGQYTELGGLPANSGPRRVFRGGGDMLWVPLENTNQIARITGVEAPPSTTPAPVISKLSLSNTRFKVGSKSTAKAAAAARRAKSGTKIRFSLDKPAVVTFTIQQRKAGKRSGKNCVKPTRKLRRKKNCSRYVTVSRQTFTRNGKAGANSVAYSGKVGRSKLRTGRYRVQLTARDATSAASTPRTKTFQIVR